MMANITAPSRPNISQPTKNAMTAPIPSAPQFILIAILYHWLKNTTPSQLKYLPSSRSTVDLIQMVSIVHFTGPIGML
jgi:hypothetical protein